MGQSPGTLRHRHGSDGKMNDIYRDARSTTILIQS